MRYAIIGWLIHDRVPLPIFTLYCLYAMVAVVLRFMKLSEER